MTNLKEIEKIANEYNNDILEVKKALKRIQSSTCRLGKQKFRPDYDEKMTKLLQEERILKEVRNLLDPKEKTVPTLTKDDIELFDYDQTIKAKKSIQSKKYHTRWLTAVEGDNDEFRQACQIEDWLNEHLKNIKPIEDTVIRKTDLITIIDTIKSNQDLSQERIIELLESLI